LGRRGRHSEGKGTCDCCRWGQRGNVDWSCWEMIWESICLAAVLGVHERGICVYTYRGTLMVAQLVEALRYKQEGRGFDSRWCHWNISLT
jgi:hypothetical protein